MKSKTFKAILAGCGAVGAVATVCLEDYLELRGIGYQLSGAGAAVMGLVLDRASTVYALYQDKRYYRLTGKHKVFESNPLIPYHPTTEDVLGLSEKADFVNFLQIASIGLSFAFPPAGYGILTSLSVATGKNLGIAKRAKQDVELIQGDNGLEGRVSD